MTGVLTLRLRAWSDRPLEFPTKGKNRPVRKATNCSLQSTGAVGGKRDEGRETDARAMAFYGTTRERLGEGIRYRKLLYNEKTLSPKVTMHPLLFRDSSFWEFWKNVSRPHF